MWILNILNSMIDHTGIGEFLDRFLLHIVGNAAGHESFGDLSPTLITCDYWGSWQACGSCFNGNCPGDQGQIRYKYRTDSYNCWCGGWPICCGCTGGEPIPGVYECRCCE